MQDSLSCEPVVVDVPGLVDVVGPVVVDVVEAFVVVVAASSSSPPHPVIIRAAASVTTATRLLENIKPPPVDERGQAISLGHPENELAPIPSERCPSTRRGRSGDAVPRRAASYPRVPAAEELLVDGWLAVAKSRECSSIPGRCAGWPGRGAFELASAHLASARPRAPFMPGHRRGRRRRAGTAPAPPRTSWPEGCRRATARRCRAPVPRRRRPGPRRFLQLPSVGAP